MVAAAVSSHDKSWNYLTVSPETIWLHHAHAFVTWQSLSLSILHLQAHTHISNTEELEQQFQSDTYFFAQNATGSNNILKNMFANMAIHCAKRVI